MKLTIYPKTIRVGEHKIIVTEKLDGSNLGFFKLNGRLLIAQRNNVFFLDELDKTLLYKGLYGWLSEFSEKIELHEGSGVFGEWIGMGKIGYGGTNINKRFYIFAKANINNLFEISNINYNRELFIFPFINQEIPSFIGIVPLIEGIEEISIENLNLEYDLYCEKVERKVEGFIINIDNQIKKYVRYKNGEMQEHFFK